MGLGEFPFLNPPPTSVFSSDFCFIWSLKQDYFLCIVVKWGFKRDWLQFAHNYLTIAPIENGSYSTRYNFTLTACSESYQSDFSFSYYVHRNHAPVSLMLCSTMNFHVWCLLHIAYCMQYNIVCNEYPIPFANQWISLEAQGEAFSFPQREAEVVMEIIKKYFKLWVKLRS